MSHGAYREAHPLPYVITHYTHLISMIVLAFTGFYIHYGELPFIKGSMGTMRQLHFIFMYVVLVALVARVYFAFVGRSTLTKGTREQSRDVGNFLPQEENRGQLIQTVKYYLFLRKTHPISGKYNPMQKLAYVAMGGFLLIQAYTGFVLYPKAWTWPILGPFFLWGVSIAGGSLMLFREIHFFIMWIFILITMIHVYLSVAEDVEAVPLMFAWKETPAED